ncbi:MAG: C25 family cysteine peptidase [Candidatus Fermentibacteria bacterium]
MFKVLTISFLLFAVTASAEVVYRAEEFTETARYLGIDAEGILLEFNLPALTVEDETVGDFGSGDILRIPGEGMAMPVGSPDLPTVRRMVLIPNTGDIRAEIVSEESSQFGIYHIPPAQPSPLRNGEVFPFRVNEELYSISEYYPASAVEVENIFILRDIRVAWVRFSPVRYNPVTGETIITTNVTVRLISEGTGENELHRATSGITRSFIPMYEEVLGFEYDGSDAVDGSYLVIGTEESIGYAQDLIDWKRQRGYEIEYGVVPTIGSTAAEIDTWIENAFNTWPNPPEWLLIMGDHNIVPTPYYNGHAADNLYGVMGTATSIPSIHYGRITGYDTDDLPYITSKILNYESDPFQPAQSWFQKAISIGDTGSLDPEHSWDYAEIFMGAGMTVDYFCYTGGMAPTTANVFNSIEEGKSLVSFIGHGSMTGWTSPSCGSISDVQSMTNGRMLPWINSIACQNGKFDTGYCFAEAWMGEGEISSPKGAVGIMAATTNSPFGQTDSLAINTFRAYFEENLWHMGAAVDYGKMKVEEYYNTGAYDSNHMHMIFGCPEFDIIIDTSILTYVACDHPATIEEGSWNVTVTADGSPVEGALVGVVQDTTLLQSGYTDASGLLTLAIPSIPGTEYVTVTCTYHNLYPYVDSVPVSGVGVSGGETGALSFGLSVPAPNPSAGSAAIAFTLPETGNMSLDIYDVSGRLVTSIASGSMLAGSHSVIWAGTDSAGAPAPGGIYLLRLSAGGNTITRSCVIIR